ncbi:MAG TPA: hypothetical protein VGE86_00280, partial [Thermoanaerobaculia bacterium]
MKFDVRRSTEVLDEPLGMAPRLLALAAAIILIAVYFLPLWSLTMFAPQYQDGLRLYIYAYKLDGGNGGQDVREVDNLNHYIGMKTLTTEDFTEFKWIPFAVGAFALLFLRAAAIGKVGTLLDLTVLYVYFSLFSLASFAYKLYLYGHNLDPKAAIKVDPFMPPMIGFKKIANFDIYS